MTREERTMMKEEKVSRKTLHTAMTNIAGMYKWPEKHEQTEEAKNAKMTTTTTKMGRAWAKNHPGNA